MIITPRQCRMARAGLGLTLCELACNAQVSVNTLRRFEDDGRVTMRTIVKVQAALLHAGAKFAVCDTVSLSSADDLASL
ncbi:protein of unknown function (plasmid) [Rhodovastum atsumiense]|uniref:XRE family transcriptional regulator n=1 Tax=Rhodovastum atsumiense TaxID=504468 RepID=UPI0020251532|nr:XRE family transcriptional regulator [Rhodovastum atsumiense]CAH2605467.1 protein of unknown function [Rhodovastum atsumiense]